MARTNLSNLLLAASQRAVGVHLNDGQAAQLVSPDGFTITVEPTPKSDPLTEALRRYGKAIGLQPEFVDAVVDGQGLRDMFARGGPVDKVQTPVGRVVFPDLKKPAARPKPKRVKDVAPSALSTWEFDTNYLQRMHGISVSLVGQHHRERRDQDVLGYKRVGNMALLVAEPDNQHDLNAVMVLVWDDVAKHWRHAGYVRATQAASLRGKWTGDHRNVMVARITSIPANADGHRDGRNIQLTLTGEVRTYPGYNAQLKN